MKFKYKTYLTGGALRDELLGLTPKDYDYVMLAPSFDAMKQALIEQGAKLYVEKPQFLTIRANHPTLGSVDFACGRGDGIYTDGRHPDSVTLTQDIFEDLERRDFTINAIAKDVETGEMIDPHCGIQDIENKVIRCVGDPTKRFNEDKLRMLRAVRFSVCKGMRIDPETSFAIHNIGYASNFNAVSVERIREELVKMFTSDSYKSMEWLFNVYTRLGDLVKARGIWFIPTIKAK